MSVYKLSASGGLKTGRSTYTSMLAGNETFFPSDIDLISTQIIGSAVTSLTFSSIPAGYKHLQIRVVSNVQNDLTFRFNGDSGGNYSYHYNYANLSGNNFATGAAANATYGYMGYVNSSSSTVQASFIMDIVDAFSTSKFKTARTLSSTVPDTANARFIMLNSSMWRSTAAINSINIFTSPTSNLNSGSRFSLYGIRG